MGNRRIFDYLLSFEQMGDRIDLSMYHSNIRTDLLDKDTNRIFELESLEHLAQEEIHMLFGKCYPNRRTDQLDNDTSRIFFV